MKYITILLFALSLSSCDITDFIKPSLNACKINEASDFFGSRVSCVDMLVDIGQANEAKQLCTQWDGEYIPSAVCFSKDKKMACEYEASSSDFKGDVVAWYKPDISDEAYQELSDECSDLSGSQIEQADFEEKIAKIEEDSSENIEPEIQP